MTGQRAMSFGGKRLQVRGEWVHLAFVESESAGRGARGQATHEGQPGGLLVPGVPVHEGACEDVQAHRRDWGGDTAGEGGTSASAEGDGPCEGRRRDVHGAARVVVWGRSMSMADADADQLADVGRQFKLRLRKSARARHYALSTIRELADGTVTARIGGAVRGCEYRFMTRRQAEAAVNRHYNQALQTWTLKTQRRAEHDGPDN